MTSFKDARNLLLESYNDGIIDDDEFILLYEGNFWKNPEFPYEYNERFNFKLNSHKHYFYSVRKRKIECI